jgi:hypothetical protein
VFLASRRHSFFPVAHCGSQTSRCAHGDGSQRSNGPTADSASSGDVDELPRDTRRSRGDTVNTDEQLIDRFADAMDLRGLSAATIKRRRWTLRTFLAETV